MLLPGALCTLRRNMCFFDGLGDAGGSLQRLSKGAPVLFLGVTDELLRVDCYVLTSDGVCRLMWMKDIINDV